MLNYLCGVVMKLNTVICGDCLKKKKIVSFSGGKDSTAMLIRMIELDMQIDEIVFADTKAEFPEIYEHILKVEKYIGRKITILKTKDHWRNWFYGKNTKGKLKGQIRGFPLLCFGCYWSRESKYKQLESFCNGHIRYIGIAYDEPKRIGTHRDYKYPLFEWKWTERDCIIYLKKIGLLGDIYSKFSRTGCWWCPKQSKKSLITLVKEYPKYWEQLKKLEKDSPQGFNPNFSLTDIELLAERRLAQGVLSI